MNEKKYLQLNDIEAYKTAFHLSNYAWKVIDKWDWFQKRTVGVQFVNAVDSISANIAEGFGRFFKKRQSKFLQIRLRFYERMYGLEREVKGKKLNFRDRV